MGLGRTAISPSANDESLRLQVPPARPLAGLFHGELDDLVETLDFPLDWRPVFTMRQLSAGS